MEQAAEAGIVMGTAEDFPAIYQDLQKQFPSCEVYRYETFLRLLNNGKYRIALYRRNADGALLGYALLCSVEQSNIVWMDYLAVLKEYHARGLGQALFRALYRKYCGPFDGLMFSVEHVSAGNEALAKTQKRRIAFYEKLGARRLHAAYLQPTPEDSFPMYLYFKPRRGVNFISRETQALAISDMYQYCFSHLKHWRGLLPRFRSSIVDERFTG
ncbi:MAG: GNAT family N-acetyltransferase [Clostridiales bacterium]|jgi:ribosomal protein S18 acetylase RimI-like enzyme|nr:GNAT family N-acetyltransferase [Clostridiales bacterium]